MENAQDTQNTTTVQNAQAIEDALIQWGTKVSDSDSTQAFSFPTRFNTMNPSVVVNPTKANTADMLSIVSANDSTYVIDRRDPLDGNHPFNMLAVGSKQNGGPGFSEVRSNGQKVAMIQWGKSLTTTDGNETINFPRSFENDCYAVVTNRVERNGSAILPVVDILANSFIINRDNSIRGDEDFFWIAIGDCAVQEGNFSFPIGNGYTIKGGYAVNTSDSAETFHFDILQVGNFTSDCYSVVTTRTAEGKQDILPVSAMSATSFTIDRHKGIDNSQGFYWIAVGK